MTKIFETNTVGLDGIDDEKLEKMLREKNPCCDKVNCEEGDYQKLQHPRGVMICLKCKIEGNENYGKSAVMPKDFVSPAEKDNEKILEYFKKYQKCPSNDPASCCRSCFVRIFGTNITVCSRCLSILCVNPVVIPEAKAIRISGDKVKEIKFFSENMSFK